MGDGNGHHGHGHGHNNFRNKVWRMSDGPYCRPKHWKHNTSIATVCIVLIYIPIAMKSAKLEFCVFLSGVSLVINGRKVMSNMIAEELLVISKMQKVVLMYNFGLLITMCRNLPFGGRATRDSRVRLPRKEYARSRHQRLFEENVGKTGKDVVYEL
ncbi:hypothetical protein D0Y65_023851 [Glycine soja]|uniref:Uncharacterized protein n=1 Tax=Glycine soja TaxID=3848 RepID=A0A445IZR5_GLYSO|nr:hypothetical protein D0Y65_023851 [Glycine soja]